MIHLAIGWVHGGTVHEPFMESVVRSIFADRSRWHAIRSCHAGTGASIAYSRNFVCKEFLKGENDALLFIDTDITFTLAHIYALSEMAEHKNLKILSGIYFGKLRFGSDELAPIWFRDYGGAYTPIDDLKEGLTKLDAVGMGFCLIHRDVLEKMARTYTQDEWTWFGYDQRHREDGQVVRLGEDMTFCRRAKDCGFNTFGTTDVAVGHIKTRVENFETYAKSRVSIISSAA